MTAGTGGHGTVERPPSVEHGMISHPRTAPRRSLALALLIAATAALAACGDDDGAPADTAAPSTVAPTVAPTVATSDPVTSDPVTSDPVTSDPVTSEPVTSDPASSPAGTSQTTTELVGAPWQLVGTLTEGGEVPVPDTSAAITFLADGTVEIDTGCNTGSGRYEVVADEVRVSELALTEIACTGDAATIERDVLANLEHDLFWSVFEDRLTLTPVDVTDMGLVLAPGE